VSICIPFFSIIFSPACELWYFDSMASAPFPQYSSLCWCWNPSHAQRSNCLYQVTKRNRNYKLSWREIDNLRELRASHRSCGRCPSSQRVKWMCGMNNHPTGLRKVFPEESPTHHHTVGREIAMSIESSGERTNDRWYWHGMPNSDINRDSQ
jgi:hypothetical protein